jgi:hypothetical protein
LRSDHLKSLSFIEAGNDKPLRDSVKSSLEAGGYVIEGDIHFRNYHQAYCGVKGNDGKTVGSAWQFSVKHKELTLVGGREDELPDNILSKLSFPPKEMLYSLSPVSFSKNDNWRKSSLANIQKSERTFSRGTLITMDPAIGAKITADGTALSEAVISDGQRGLAYTCDGRRVRLPRETREISDVHCDYPIITAQTIKSRQDRAVASQFFIMDTLINHPGTEFTAVTMRSKPPFDRDDSTMAAIYSNNKIIGCVSGVDNTNFVLDSLTESNIQQGFTSDMVKPYEANDIEISDEDLSEVVNDLSMAAEHAPV